MERGMNGMAGSPPESVVEGVERAAAVGPPGPITPDDPKPGETWRHYKGRDYEIVAVGLFEADRTPMVAYRCPKSGQGWVRTLANFTEPVTVDGIAGRPVPYRRFSRVGRPKDDVSPDGKTDDLYRLAAKVGAAGGRPEDRMLDDLAGLLSTVGFRVDADHSICDCVEELIGRVWANEAVSQHGKWTTGYPPGSIAEQRYWEETEQQHKSMASAIDEIMSLCRDVAGVDAGSVVESVKTLAFRARQWAEGRSILDSRPGPVSQVGKPPVPVPLARMREAWMALQLVIARLETATHYLATPESVLLEILEGTDDVKRHLDAAMGEVEDAAGIAPDEAPH